MVSKNLGSLRYYLSFLIFQTVLKNFSLKIPGGKMVALVGASGGGE